LRPLPARTEPPAKGAGSSGDRRPREGEAAGARESVDPRGSRNRVPAASALRRSRAGVPGHARPFAGRPLCPLRAGACTGEAGEAVGGERPLQAGQLPTTSERAGQLVMAVRSEEHTSELQSRGHLVCRLLLEKKNNVVHVIYYDNCHPFLK